MSFTSDVIEIVQSIPCGRVTTYGQVALLAGHPRAARVIAGIMTRYEDGLPWHRVINRHGFISIKRLDIPKEIQKGLLENEGVVVSPDFMVDLERYGWWGSENKYQKPRSCN